MSVKENYYKLNSEEFKNYLKNLKDKEDTLCFFASTKNECFYYNDSRINDLILNINKLQWEFDSLINTFSAFSKKQIIQSYLLDEIQATNEIENIFSTRHDIFSLMKKTYKNTTSNKIKSIVNSYQLLLSENDIQVISLMNVREVYDKLLKGNISKNDLPDGTYFRKEPVYVSDGVVSVHHGFSPEKVIVDSMEEFLRFSNGNEEIYKRMIIAHYLFENIHPYYDGNGRLGRFLFSLWLYQNTKSISAFLISSAFKTYKKEYYKAFKAAEDVHEFGCLNEYVYGVAKIIEAKYKKETERLKEIIPELETEYFPYEMTKSERMIYRFLKEASLLSDFGVSNVEIMEELGLSKRMVIYAIDKLKKEDLIEDTSVGKYTYHKLK